MNALGRLAWGWTLALALGMVGCQPREDLTNADGQRIYHVLCARCHGDDGSSQPASDRAKRHFDFREPAFQEAYTDSAIRAIATYGKGKMMGVAGITDAQLDSVVAVVRSFGGRRAGTLSAPAPATAADTLRVPAPSSPPDR